MRNDTVRSAMTADFGNGHSLKNTHSKPGRGGTQQWLATGISAAVLAFAIAMPQRAAAAEQCGPPDADGFVVCQPADDQYPDGIAYFRGADAPFADAIVVVERGSEIVTETARGIDVVNLSGTVNINAEGANVRTSGDYADGVWAVAYGDSAIVTIGDVHTAGLGSSGIVAVATRVAKVTAGNIVTEGDEATGVTVIAEELSARAFVGSVTTRGNNSVGISLLAERVDPGLPLASGVIQLDAGSVMTMGDGSTGITFQTGDPLGRSTIVVDTVRTIGADAIGILGTGYGASHISAGSVITTGNNSAAIASLKDFGSDVIEAGSIETFGSNANGILAYNSFGNMEALVGKVTTHGDGSHGIFQENLNGTVSVVAGTVLTTGANANGITSASLFERTTAVIGSVETKGMRSFGAFVAGGRGVDVSIANVVTHGDDSVGVRLVSGSAGLDVPLISGKILAEIGSVKTSGANAHGVSASALGSIDLKVGQVHTTGEYSVGITSLLQANGAHNVTADAVLTEGDYADGVLISHNGGPDATMTIDLGSVQTKGALASAVRIEEEVSDAKLTLRGNVLTSGDFSHGVWLSHARGGSLAITSGAAIVTNGAGSNGINLDAVGTRLAIDVKDVTTAGDEASAIKITSIDEHVIEEQSSRMDIQAETLVTKGSNAHGIDILLIEPGGGDGGPGTMTFSAHDLPGGARDLPGARTDIDVRTKAIAVEGDASVGIRIDSIGAVRIDAGDTVSRRAEAISVSTRDLVSLQIAGQTVSGGSAAVRLSGSDLSVFIGTKGSIVAEGDALVLTANGEYTPDEEEEGGIFFPFAFAGDGMVTLDNEGVIRSEQGHAIQILAGTATISNKGLVSGRIALSAGNDSFANNGLLELAADSDFGDGLDLLVNSGVVRIRGGTVAAAGLERFENTGGLIDLRNGAAGDALILPGSYSASGNALLAVDVAAGGSDRLVIAGAATGTTGIIIAPLAGGNATLLSKRVDIVTAGAGTAANAFVLANQESGFIGYNLVHDAGTNSFGVTARAGTAIYRLAKVQDAVQALSLKSGEGWTAHTADLREAASSQRLWGQMFGGVETRKAETVAGGAAQDIGARQDFYGAQLGFDILSPSEAGAPHVGVMASYINSNLRFARGEQRAKLEATTIGAYAGMKSGPLFANALAHYDRYWLNLSDRALAWDDKISGSGFGVAAEVGLRFEGRAFFAEPVATLSWSRRSLGDVAALGQIVAFEKSDGLRGKLGLRLGTTVALGQAEVDLYAGGSYAHEFAGDDGVVLRSNGLSETIGNQRLSDYGEIVAGFRVRASARVSGFIQGTANVGGRMSGGGGRVGLRISL
jgi:fibronectin-binding autotransporter adhesin